MSAYSSMVWIHLGFNVGTGAYFLYTLFHKIGQQDLNDCQSTNDTDLTRAACRKGFEIARGILVGIYVVVWLVELCASSHCSTSLSFSYSIRRGLSDRVRLC